MKRTVLLAVLLLVGVFSAVAQSRGGDLEKVVAENLGAQANIGKQYAMFIAINNYRYWNPLKKPVSDAKEIRDILKKDYFIDEVIELYNEQATKQNIIRRFTELQSKLGVNDSLFIYYAGHGHLDKNSDAGFWIPVDGGTDQYEQSNWIPNSQIRGYISQFKTMHVFMVSDACFSGDILSIPRAMSPVIDNDYYRKAYSLTSRQVITSGSIETVPDQSEFSSAFIFCLQKNQNPLLDPLTIFNDVKLSVKETTPLYGTLNAARHQEGATFLFFRRQSSVTTSPAASPAVQPQPARTASASVGNITVTSEIAGVIMIDGEATGTRIKAGGTVTVSNVSTGATEVAVKADDGKIVKAPNTVMVQSGQTVSTTIKAPATVTPAQTTQSATTSSQSAQSATTSSQLLVPEMVRIQGGTFKMGSAVAYESMKNEDETPQHQVTISSFYIGKYEVKQSEYESVMGVNPSDFKEPNKPVWRVSWFDAVEYCNKLSQREGFTPVYTISGNGDSRTVQWNRNANGYRLPTEAEWEYACRAGTITWWSWGNDNDWDLVQAGGGSPTTVGSYKPNAWGLYDMHGNVSEWCWDWYGPYSSEAQTDPIGKNSPQGKSVFGDASGRVNRGGKSNSASIYTRSAVRFSDNPTDRSGMTSNGGGKVIGFRVVRNAK